MNLALLGQHMLTALQPQPLHTKPTSQQPRITPVTTSVPRTSLAGRTVTVATLPQLNSEEQATHARFTKNKGFFGLGVHFSLSNDAQKLTDLYLQRLGELEKVRASTGSADYKAANEAEIRETFKKTEEFLERMKSRTFVFLGKADKAKLAKLQQKQALIKLQLKAMQSVFGEAPARPTVITGRQETQLKAYIDKSCHAMLRGTRRHALNAKKLDELENTYRSLSDAHAQDRDRMLQAIADYRAALAAHPERKQYLETKDPVKERAAALYQQLRRQHPEFVLLLLGDPALQELFSKQVIRDGLDIEVFLKHPLVADFLRRSESLEKSVVTAGDQITIGAESGLPEIKFNGKLIPVRDLPGFDKSFRNLHGWRTLGLSEGSSPHSIHAGIEKATEVDGNGYVYTKEHGLVAFNPRTWSWKQADGSWKPIDLDREDWWTQLPPYKTEEVEVEAPGDAGWRMEWVTTSTEHGPQASKTHAFSCLVIPQGPVVNGKVKVAYYPFGMFAFLFRGSRSALSHMNKEMLYLDQNLHETDRHFTSWQEVITPEEGRRALEQVRQERQETLAEGRGDAPSSFQLGTNNCGNANQRVASAMGEEHHLPVASPVEAVASGVYKVALKVLKWVPPLRRTFLRFFGASEELVRNWDFVPSSTYTMRMYLQLKEETDLLMNDPERLRRQRIPMVRQETLRAL